MRFTLLPGQRHDTAGVAPLKEGIAFGALIADKAFDTNWIIQEINERGSAVVLSQHSNRWKPRQIDHDLCTWRHHVENCFGKLKKFKPIAMRADKTDQSFAALFYLSAAVIKSRRISAGPSRNL